MVLKVAIANICSAWFLDIRISTCCMSYTECIYEASYNILYGYVSIAITKYTDLWY